MGSRIFLFVYLAIVCTSLLGCNTVADFTDTEHTQPDVLDRVRSIDLLPRSETPVQQAELNIGKRAKPIIYRAEPADPDLQTSAKRQAVQSGAGETFELNFENVAIASVAKVVLGDILGVGYVIDTRVQGTVSLSSARPVPKSNILFALENALRTAGVALIRDDTAYRLVPQADAVGAGPIEDPERSEPGYGISVVPLQYVSAQMLTKLVENFGTKAGMLRAEPSRNLILVQGTGIERRNAVDLLLSFDVDWMLGQTVGIFPVQNTNPEPVIAELEKIIDSGEGGIAQHVVRLQPIGRMNAILAVTRKPEMLKRIETWITRLDNTVNARSSIHIYYLKFGEARQIARAINEIFGNSGTGSNFDSAAGQIAPGSGVSSSGGASALSRLSVGQPNQTGSSFGSGSRGASGSGTDATQAGLGATPNSTQGSGLFENAGGNTGASGGHSGGAGVLDGVRITADSVNNALIVYASQEQYTIIEQAVRRLDRPQRQVAIEATIAEVTLTDDLQFGVQSYITSHGLGLKPNTGSVSNSTASSVISAAGDVVLNRVIPGFNFLVGSGTTPNVILNALHAVTDVKVLSNPSLVVLNNQVATLQVGNEVPIQTGTATVLTGNNTVASTQDYKSTGVILRVVPRINANGNVRLDIEQEISNVLASPNTSTAASTTTASTNPTISTRKLRSSISVASGQTVLLAGLISDNQNRTRSGIPGLDKIPGVGDLFATTDNNVQRDELVIFIRPQIIRDGNDAYFVAEEVRSKLRGTVGTVESQKVTNSKYR